MNKSSSAQLKKILYHIWIDTISIPPTEFTFSPYCHEYYDRYDVRSPFELQHGLDDVKLNQDRAYIGNVPLVDFLANIGKDLENRVEIHDGRNDYDQGKLSFNSKKNTDANTTIFLINEKNVDTSNARYPGPLRYLMCYAQKYLNGNAFITFNERKPGRIAPVTLPRTLSAAMINIAMPYLLSSTENGSTNNANELLTIIDHFVGTGTMILEAIKLHGAVVCHGADLNPVAEILVKDNIRFFSLPTRDINRLHAQVIEYLKSKPSIDQGVFALGLPA